AFQRYLKKQAPEVDLELASTVQEGKYLLGVKRYDVVVTDYLLGAETGFAIIDAVKGVPVIFLTGQGDQQTAVKAMKKGAFDYLVKESSGNYLEQLLNTIEKAFSHSNTAHKLKE